MKQLDDEHPPTEFSHENSYYTSTQYLPTSSAKQYGDKFDLDTLQDTDDSALQFKMQKHFQGQEDHQSEEADE